MLQCTWCGVAAVCGPAHLALHRPHTKCLPFRVAELPGRGRGLVATRTIRARSVFVCEADL